LPLLTELHWQPSNTKKDIKIVITAFKVLTTQQPSYLVNIRFRAADDDDLDIFLYIGNCSDIAYFIYFLSMDRKHVTYLFL